MTVQKQRDVIENVKKVVLPQSISMKADKEENITVNVKKIVPWATGYAIFITKEARALGWDNKDYVIITSSSDREGGRIEIRRAPIGRK